ncbi:MAG: HIT domain-containing protein [Chloroflexi bacterium]|nr:HIT domain-containing protein [Chloroflexota bacterium]
MEYLWAPWRIQYIQMEKPRGCILCDKPAEDNDVANYILYRGVHNFIMLNAYPYNAGHLMIAPGRHTANLEKLTDEELTEHFRLVSRSVGILKQVFKPDGFNIGINLGFVAGAGIHDHIHTHIVPRWQADTNFMPVTADTKVVNEALSATYQKLKDRFAD